MKARFFRLLCFSLSLIGCAKIIGADFDELRPAPACKACTGGSAQADGGRGGKSQEAGTTSTGGVAGSAGRATLAGGTTATGGTGIVEPPIDAGAAGFGGEGGVPTVDPCSTHLECVERHDGEAYICRRANCVRVTSDACPLLLPSATALASFREEANPILLGGFASLDPTSLEGLASVNWDMALSEFHDGTWGGITFASGEQRPLVAVVCNSNGDDFMPALEHLTEKLNVSGVLSTLPPEKLLAAYEFTARAEFLSRNDEVFFLSDNAADFRLANLSDRVWHMLGNPRALATTIAGAVRYIELHVATQLEQNHAVTGVDGSETPLRLTLVTSDELSLLDAANVLTAGDALSPNSNLTFNQQLAVLQPGLFRRSRVDAAVGEILQDPPHIIVALAGPEISDVIHDVEVAWGSNDRTQGVMRPYWVLYDSAAHAPDLPGALASLELLTPPPSERVVGVTFARSQEDTAQWLYGAYQSRLLMFYENGALSPILPGTHATYEAAYALMYAYVGGGSDGRKVRATDLRNALNDRVFSPEMEAVSVSIGPAHVPLATSWLGRPSGGSIALYGTMGAPNFDRSSGTRVLGTSLWCLEPENTSNPYVYDALLYDPVADTFSAPVMGPGSCAAQYYRTRTAERTSVRVEPARQARPRPQTP